MSLQEIYTVDAVQRLTKLESFNEGLAKMSPQSQPPEEAKTNPTTTPHPPQLSHSPETRPSNLNDTIFEEDEDETSSEPAEAITPTSDSHPQTFSKHNVLPAYGLDGTKDPASKPITIKTTATSPRKTNDLLPSSETSPTTPTTPQAAPATSIPDSKRPHKSSIRSIFRRSNSQMTERDSTRMAALTAAAPPALVPPRKPSFSFSANHSPATSRSNTPPSPGSPSSTVNSNTEEQRAAAPTSDPVQKPSRALTGLGLKNRGRIMFGNNTKLAPEPSGFQKRRSSASNLAAFMNQPSPQGEFFTRPAATGAGLKARRMSASLPDDFTVDTTVLDKEFTTASRVPGRRGKLLGSGATATVKLMHRKGHGDEIYAVKEFRKKASHEDANEYDKKVKSEYCIAHSLHHPNIVNSIRLATHSGRWNVVMEFCPLGEMFTLIQRRYLDVDDKLCLWKQLLRGVTYLHDHGIAHRDIKLENLLMTNDGELKITDFGVSEVFSGEHPGMRGAGGECGKNMKEVRRCAPGICGSLPYIAPEVLDKKGEYDPRPLDVWSTAIVLLSMLYVGNPWPEARTGKGHKYYDAFSSGWSKFLSDPEAHPDGRCSEKDGLPDHPHCGAMFTSLPKPAIKILLLKMLHPDPAKRISIQDALNDRWVKTIDCCSLEPLAEDGEVDGGIIAGLASTGKTKSGGIDAAGVGSGRLVSKLRVKRSHNHIPPPKQKAFSEKFGHRFDMGDGWS